MRRYALVLLLLAAPLRAEEPPKASPPVLTLPAEKVTPVGKPVTVVPLKNEGQEIRWTMPDAGLEEERGFLDLIPEEFRSKLTGRMFYANKTGRFRVWAFSARGNVVSDKAECIIVVGDAPPPVPPVPVPPSPDVFNAAMATAYKSDGSPSAAAKTLASLYRVGSQSTVNDAALVTLNDLYATMAKAGATLVPPPALTATRKVIAAELTAKLGNDPAKPLDAATRKACADQFNRMAAALDTLTK